MIGAIRPIVDLDSKPYWEWLQKKDFRLQKCGECGKFRFPPYPSCPYCGKGGGEWISLLPKGRIYSWFVVNITPEPRFKEDIPYIIALIELEVGPRIVGRLTGCTPEKVRADMPVIGKYHEVDQELTLLVFEPDKVA